MRVEIKYAPDLWGQIRDSALFTIGKDGGGELPSSDWKRRMLLAEHSPIRCGAIIINCYDVPTFVVNHFVRHHEGFTPFVQSKRKDRSEWVEDKVPDRNTLIGMRFIGNFQAFINISRKRFCRQASLETQQAWALIMAEVADYEPELDACCVRECVYRGWCPEFKKCGYSKTEAFKKELEEYRYGER